MTSADKLEALALYYRRGFEILSEYRDEGVRNIPIKEYYKKRLGSGYDDWASMGIYRDGSDLYRGTIRWLGGEVYVDVSDSYYQALSHDEKRMFEQRERERRRHGFWVDTSEFLALPERDRVLLRSKDFLSGRVQLLTGSHYFMLFYAPVEIMDVDGVRSMAYYNRKNAQLFENLDVLQLYPLKRGEARQGIITTKPRSCYFTTTIHTYMINNQISDDSFSCSTVIDNGRKVVTDTEKYNSVIESLPKWLTEQYAIRPSIKEDNSSIVVSKRMGDGVMLVNRMDSTHPKPKQLEGSRYKLLRAEEMGLYEYNIRDVLTRAGDTLKGSAGVRVGLLVVGGVLAKGNRNLEVIKDMSRRPKQYGMFSWTMGVQHFRYADPVTGWADEDRCIDEELEFRDRLSKEDRLDELQSHIIQNGIYPDDFYYTVGSSYINIQSLMRHSKSLEQSIASGEVIIRQGRFIENEDDYLNPIWVPGTNQSRCGWYLVEHPDQNEIHRNGRPQPLYVSGSDNFQRSITESAAMAATQQQGGSKYSVQAIAVQKVMTKEIVAIYIHRDSDPNYDWLQSLLGCMYFNMLILPERNKEGQIDFIVNHSASDRNRNYNKGYFTRYLMPTPQPFSSARSQVRNKYGADTTASKREMFLTYVVPYADQYPEKILFPQILQSLIEWDIDKKGNTPDLGMALMLCLIASKHLNIRSLSNDAGTSGSPHAVIRNILVNSRR